MEVAMSAHNEVVIFSTTGLNVTKADGGLLRIQIGELSALFTVAAITDIKLVKERDYGLCQNENGAKVTASLDGGMVHLRLIVKGVTTVYSSVQISPNEWGKLYESLGDLKEEVVPEPA